MKKLAVVAIFVLFAFSVFAQSQYYEVGSQDTGSQIYDNYGPTEFAKIYGSKTVNNYKGNNNYKTPFDFEKRLGVQRVSNFDPRVNIMRTKSSVALSPPGPVDFKGVGRGGYAPMYPRGTAFVSSSVFYGFPRCTVNIQTLDLPASEDISSQFETWVVDEDTGYRLSLGTFMTMKGGVGRMLYNAEYYLDPFEWVEVTVEPYGDTDLSPGPIILLGRIPPANMFDPVPKSSMMITPSFRTY